MDARAVTGWSTKELEEFYGSLWIALFGTNKLGRVDVATGALSLFDLSCNSTSLALSGSRRTELPWTQRNWQLTGSTSRIPRLVLFCDVHRPMRGPISGAINRFVVRHVVPMSQSPNTPGDPVGWGNRLFAAMRPIRVGIAALKARSVVAYYGVKYAVGIAIVGVLVWWH